VSAIGCEELLPTAPFLSLSQQQGPDEGLQQEGSLAMPYIGQILGRPWDLEADRRVKLLCSLEVACRDEGFGFDSGQIHAWDCDSFGAK
jgi:hypothetical protein